MSNANPGVQASIGQTSTLSARGGGGGLDIPRPSGNSLFLLSRTFNLIYCKKEDSQQLRNDWSKFDNYRNIRYFYLSVIACDVPITPQMWFCVCGMVSVVDHSGARV